jgi:mannose-6-phosphate isomerase-like protein (cupin superfamily)
MYVKRNWMDEAPYVGHESAIIWPIFRGKGTKNRTFEQAPLEGMSGFTRHLMQGGKSGDYHSHEAEEQLYYFIKGNGKMKIDDVVFDVQEGDAVYIPVNAKHQLINNSSDWIEHILVSAPVPKQ